MLKGLFKYRDLLFMLTFRDIRIRYKQAAMGFVWAIFMPIMAVLAGVIVKKAISVVSGRPLDLASVVSISIKVLPWTFFVSSIRFSVQSLVGNNNLITKIYFPKEVLPFSSVLACLFDFLIAAVSLTVLLAIMRIGVSIYLFLVPILLLFLILFTAGLSLILSSANLFYRDVKYIVEIILMFGIFFTPVFYETNSFGKWKPLLLFNPVGSILESLNNVVVLHKMPEPFWFLYLSFCAIAIFILGLVLFRKTESYFAENI